MFTCLLAGSSGCGKSYTLIQAVQYAAANNWLVFYFPYGMLRHPTRLENARFLDSPLVIDTVNSSTSYVYDPRTRTYTQPVYASRTLQNFSEVNSQLLQNLETSENVPIEGRATIPKGAPLTDLIAVGAKDQNSAPAILSTLLEILGKQTKWVVRYGNLGCC